MVITYFLEENREHLEEFDLESEGDSGPETDCGWGPQMNCENGWLIDDTFSLIQRYILYTRKSYCTILSFKIMFLKSRELFTCTTVCPVKGEMIFVTNFSQEYVGDPIANTIGRDGISGLCILGSP